MSFRKSKDVYRKQGRPADYESTCHVCGDHIGFGDLIVSDDEYGWIHEECQ